MVVVFFGNMKHFTNPITLLWFFLALISLESCAVDKAIAAEDYWFHKAMKAEDHVVAVGVDSMAFSVLGDGADTLVLVHGFGPYPRVQWQPVTWSLSDDMTMVVVDLLGFGQSYSPDNVISVSSQVSAIAAVIDSLGIARAHVMGHSCGGMVAALFASLHPDQVKSLVLIDPLHRHYEKSIMDSIEQAHGLGIEDILLPQSEAAFDVMKGLTIAKDVSFLPNVLKKHVVDKIYTVNQSQRQGLLSAVERDIDQLRAEATGGNMPTALIWGEVDHLFPVATGQLLLADYPEGEFMVIAGAGHTPHLEDPWAFMRCIQGFYDGL